MGLNFRRDFEASNELTSNDSRETSTDLLARLESDWHGTETNDGCAGAIDRAAILAEFEIARNGDVILVPVIFAGREYPFLVDTGSTLCVVDVDLKPQLKTTGTVASLNGRGDFAVYSLPQTVIGRSRLPVDGDTLCLDLEPFRRVTGCNVRGILGMNFLKQHVMRIDFDTGRLAFLRACPVSAGTSFDLSYSQSNCPILDLDIGQDECISFKIDTGHRTRASGDLRHEEFEKLRANGQLTDSERTSHSLTLQGMVLERVAQLDRLRLGEFEHSNLEFADGDGTSLGLTYLSRYVVTFDFQNDRIFLAKGERFERD